MITKQSRSHIMWNPRIDLDLNLRYNHVPFSWRQEVLGKVTMIIISIITTIIITIGKVTVITIARFAIMITTIIIIVFIFVIIIIIGQMTTKAADMINALEAVW